MTRREFKPWAVAGLVVLAVALALFGWAQVRSYQEFLSRSEKLEARIESEVPHPGGGLAAVPEAAPATPAGMLDVVITLSPAAEEGDGEAVSSTTIQVGEDTWTLPSTPGDTWREIEDYMRSVIEEHGITKGTVHMHVDSSLDPGLSTGIVMRMSDIFGRADAKLEVVFESRMPPAFEAAK